jgi:hypothetical protein
VAAENIQITADSWCGQQRFHSFLISQSGADGRKPFATPSEDCWRNSAPGKALDFSGTTPARLSLKACFRHLTSYIGGDGYQHGRFFVEYSEDELLDIESRK